MYNSSQLRVTLLQIIKCHRPILGIISLTICFTVSRSSFCFFVSSSQSTCCYFYSLCFTNQSSQTTLFGGQRNSKTLLVHDAFQITLNKSLCPPQISKYLSVDQKQIVRCHRHVLHVSPLLLVRSGSFSPMPSTILPVLRVPSVKDRLELMKH